MRLIALSIIWLLCVSNSVFAGAIMDQIPTSEKLIALTIENAQSTDTVVQALRLLQEQGVRATFFISAKTAGENETLVRTLVSAGNDLGNYGVEPQYWGDTPSDAIKQQLVNAGDRIAGMGGKPQLIKPPFGYYEDNFLQAVTDYRPETTIVRGIDTGDWMLTTPQAVLERVLNQAGNGSIVNINMQAKTAVAALPSIISDLKNAGYRFVTISELLEKGKKQEQQAKQPTEKVQTLPYRVLYSRPLSQPAVALTFDDGGNTAQVNELLAVLRANDVKSTFFLLGNWIEANPRLVKLILEDGHEIANHSYSHPQFTRLSKSETENEIQACETALTQSAGQTMKRYFRPPYGDFNNMTSTVLQDKGYQAMVIWSVDSRDWTGASSAQMQENIMRNVTNGSIVLFHLHGANTVAALGQLIPKLREQGYQCVTISEMLKKT
ncbi:polysaccharide deacetylase family protein [Anaerospora sp.]|uniref:polysaccharide deacetylase family protein n=1 Tax=Anaerospora sp. TaxID=1960278 RepID=UPI00289CF326|nr:polysaccharide deacetylase family protein [Anaerospora sp.]